MENFTDLFFTTILIIFNQQITLPIWGGILLSTFPPFFLWFYLYINKYINQDTLIRKILAKIIPREEWLDYIFTDSLSYGLRKSLTIMMALDPKSSLYELRYIVVELPRILTGDPEIESALRYAAGELKWRSPTEEVHSEE